MTRTSFEDYNCSVARSLNILGDRWTMLIVRDAFYGVSTFSQFQKRLGIARNVLSDRLEQLVHHEVLQRKPVRPGVERYVYRLTERGKTVFPILIALMQWGDRWTSGNSGGPVLVLDRESHAPIQSIGVLSRDGRYLTTGDVEFAAGPGATDDTLRAFESFRRMKAAAAK